MVMSLNYFFYWRKMILNWSSGNDDFWDNLCDKLMVLACVRSELESKSELEIFVLRGMIEKQFFKETKK